MPMFIMHLHKRIDEIPKRDEQILGGICAPLTGQVLKAGLTSFFSSISFGYNFSFYN